MKTFGSLSSSSAKASFNASLTVYVFDESAYPRIDVNDGVILWSCGVYVDRCTNLDAGLNSLDVTILAN